MFFLTSLVETEYQLEGVLAGQSHKVPCVELREYNNGCCSLGQIELEACIVVISSPGNLDGRLVLRDVLVICEDSSPPDLNISTKEIGIWDPENAIVAELMVQSLKSFCCPFFGSIIPRPVPFCLASGIFHKTETVAFVFDGSEKRVRVVVLNSLSTELVWVGVSVFPGTSTDYEFFVDFEEYFGPELVFVEDIGSHNLGGNPTSEIFNSLPVNC